MEMLQPEEKKWMTVHGKTTCPITIQTSPCPQTKKMVIIYIFSNCTLTLFATGGGYCFYPFLVLGTPNDDGSWQDNLSDYNSDFSLPFDQKECRKTIFQNFRGIFLQILNCNLNFTMK
jgi:hypothetical protein